MLNSVVVCAPKISGYASGYHCRYLSKELVVCFLFDLYGFVVLVAVHFISEITKFESTIAIFEHNNVYLSATLRINVFL